jgi:ribonuclease-3
MNLDLNSESSSTQDSDRYISLYHKISYTFKDYNLIHLAMTHRSLQVDGLRMDYERLEFLGDAVLDLVVAQLLLDVHIEAKEGDLSKMRAALVNTASLAEVARELELGSFVRLSKAEVQSGGSDRDSTLADVLEALIGAIYKEAGFDSAFAVIRTIFIDRINSVQPNDPKTELQEFLHKLEIDSPRYELEKVDGPQHAPVFNSAVYVETILLGKGEGKTKKASQQTAAAEALALLNSDPDLQIRISKSAKSIKEITNE